MIINLVKNKITEGRVFENPGGGVTEVVRVTELGIYYKRGNSKMLIKYGDIEKMDQKSGKKYLKHQRIAMYMDLDI